MKNKMNIKELEVTLAMLNINYFYFNKDIVIEITRCPAEKDFIIKLLDENKFFYFYNVHGNLYVRAEKLKWLIRKFIKDKIIKYKIIGE
jgi:hypothetical protein